MKNLSKKVLNALLPFTLATVVATPASLITVSTAVAATAQPITTSTAVATRTSLTAVSTAATTATVATAVAATAPQTTTLAALAWNSLFGDDEEKEKEEEQTPSLGIAVNPHTATLIGYHHVKGVEKEWQLVKASYNFYRLSGLDTQKVEELCPFGFYFDHGFHINGKETTQKLTCYVTEKGASQIVSEEYDSGINFRFVLSQNPFVYSPKAEQLENLQFNLRRDSMLAIEHKTHETPLEQLMSKADIKTYLQSQIDRLSAQLEKRFDEIDFDVDEPTNNIASWN